MHDESDAIILRELYDSETLLWAGRPRQGFVLRPVDALLIPFSIMWGGFAIFWEASVLSLGAPTFFALWGIPFVLVGLHFMIGRFFVDMRQRAVTTYGVTSERIVIISGIFSRQVKSLSIDTLTDLSLSQRSRRGIITFGSMPYMAYWYSGAAWFGSGQQFVPTFDLGENAREVYEIVLAAKRKAKQQPS
jgi:hypothetical protein